MAKDKETIKTTIQIFIKMNGSKAPDWYVGITSDPEKRLFEEHGVKKNDTMSYIYEDCGNAEIAREIEDHFVNTFGTYGNPGGGDDSSRFVYAYKKMSYTKP